MEKVVGLSVVSLSRVGRPKVSTIHFLRLSLYRGSSRGMLVVFEVLGPSQMHVLEVSVSFCEAPEKYGPIRAASRRQSRTASVF